MITLSQSTPVSLTYRYWNSQWSHEENRVRYGHLASEEGVGGSWRIEIGRRDDDEAAFAPELARLKGVVDQRCLFMDLEAFLRPPSTLENVTAYLGAQLFATSEWWSFLTIHESERLSCTVRAGKEGLELNLKIMNLELALTGVQDESGLMTSRQQVTQSVIEIHRSFGDSDFQSEKTWAETLFETLRSRVKGLASVRVDLGREKYIVVRSNPL